MSLFLPDLGICCIYLFACFSVNILSYLTASVVFLIYLFIYLHLSIHQTICVPFILTHSSLVYFSSLVSFSKEIRVSQVKYAFHASRLTQDCSSMLSLTACTVINFATNTHQPPRYGILEAALGFFFPGQSSRPRPSPTAVLCMGK